MNLDELESNLDELDRRCFELEVSRKQITNNVSSLTSEIKSLEEESLILEKVSSLFKHLLDVLLDQKKKDIEQLVTYGLRTVIDDQDLKFHIDISPKYNSIHTSFRTEHVGVAEGNVLDNFGGGIVNMESFLLRIITIFQTKLSPYLILDESFANLSEDYVENCSNLLKSLCDQLGLTIFLVTHEPLMLAHADKVYRVTSKSSKLRIEEAK